MTILCPAPASSPLGSDISFKQALSAPSGWQSVAFDDSGWAATEDRGAYGVGPWGNVSMPAGTPAHWIWRPGTPANTPVYFRKTFFADAKFANVTVTADDAFDLWVNGQHVASGSNWSQPVTVAVTLNQGQTNVIAVSATDFGGAAGLLVDVRTPTTLGSDASFMVTRSTPPANWQSSISMDLSNWGFSTEEGGYGDSPWGTVPVMPIGTSARWIREYFAPEVSTSYFRHTFVPSASSATITVAADDTFTLWVNGQLTATGSNWTVSSAVTVPLNAGTTNLIAVQVSNTGGPGGLLLDMRW
jgi:hypothetical protein